MTNIWRDKRQDREHEDALKRRQHARREIENRNILNEYDLTYADVEDELKHENPE